MTYRVEIENSLDGEGASYAVYDDDKFLLGIESYRANGFYSVYWTSNSPVTRVLDVLNGTDRFPEDSDAMVVLKTRHSDRYATVRAPYSEILDVYSRERLDSDASFVRLDTDSNSATWDKDDMVGANIVGFLSGNREDADLIRRLYQETAEAPVPDFSSHFSEALRDWDSDEDSNTDVD